MPALTLIGLADLPSELLSNTATILPPEDAVALAQTCRSLYQSTNDSFVFESIIRRRQHQWENYSDNINGILQRASKDASVLTKYGHFDAFAQHRLFAEDSAFASLIRKRFGRNVDAWSRYAVADSKAFQLCELMHDVYVMKNPEAHAGSLLSAMDYLPHLFILKHPSIHSLGLAPALMMQFKVSNQWQGPVDPRLAFSFCAAMLSQDTPFMQISKRRGQQTAKEVMETFYAETTSQKSALVQTLTNCLEHNRRVITQADAHIILASFSCLVRQAFRDYKVNNLIGSDYYTFILPFFVDMPLSPAVSLPFSTSWDSWHAAHIYSATDPYDIASHEWVGCMSTDNTNPITIEAPMRKIRFIVTDDALSPTSYSVSVVGKDNRGQFTLHGNVMRNGTMFLRRTDARGIDWDWLVTMTTFGIVGLWGSSDGFPYIKGSIWLWVNGWTD